MDKIINILDDLNIKHPKQQPHRFTEQQLTKLIPFEDFIKKQQGDKYMISDVVLFRLDTLVDLVDKPELLDTLLTLKGLNGGIIHDYDFEDENTEKYIVSSIRQFRNEFITPIMNKHYPPANTSSINENTFKDNSPNTIVEYNMLIKNAHFDIVYKQMYHNVKPELLGTNPYKHKSDLKKKFLKGDVEKVVNGKRMLDHQLVMFNRLFHLEMMMLGINEL